MTSAGSPERQLPSTIAGQVRNELVIKKSRFITHLIPAVSVAEADAVIAGLRKEFWDARHNCVALIVGPHGDQQRSSDDGEPSGTAGVPMLEVLRHHEVTDLVAVVTRYFGGVLLGAGGLVRAYSSSVARALDVAQIVRRVPMSEQQVVVPHADVGRFENLVRDWVADRGGIVEGVGYAEKATITVLVPPADVGGFAALLAAHSGGGLVPQHSGLRIAEVP